MITRSRPFNRPVWSGVAVVCCVHDVQKNQIRTDRDLVTLSAEIGIVYDPKQHKIHDCSCCNNLFVDPSDTPQYCHHCRLPAIHTVMAPIDAPKGVVQ
jgi:hypothetical protein